MEALPGCTHVGMQAWEGELRVLHTPGRAAILGDLRMNHHYYACIL